MCYKNNIMIVRHLDMIESWQEKKSSWEVSTKIELITMDRMPNMSYIKVRIIQAILPMINTVTVH